MRKQVLEEQETTINISRTDNFATVYSCDTLVIARLDKLVAAHPEVYKVTNRDEYGVKYRIDNKRLVRFAKPISDAQREVCRVRALNSLGKSRKSRAS